MAKKLWGGRFSKPTNKLVEEFTKSIDYDYKLAKYDVLGSMIHVDILKNGGFLLPDESTKLDNALDELYEEIDKSTVKIDKKYEDVHTWVQAMVEKKVGDLVLKLHAARSRNDQVLFDLKLFCKIELLEIAMLVGKVGLSLVKTGRWNDDVIIPGYTHLQRAQLVKLRTYLQSYDEMLERDKERISDIQKKIQLSLGSGALAGTPIPEQIYKEAVKKFISEDTEFSKMFNLNETVGQSKALDTVSDRDFVIEILSALSILGMHLSRFAEDLIIWSTKEFGFVELDDAFAMGSSLMPQKKNPDVLELIRGYTGTLYGNLMNVLTMMKGLPLTYNRDMQLDKPPLFSSFEIIEKELKVLPPLIESLTWNKKRIANTIKEDESLYATDFVYYLIKEKGIPFKTAHDIIGQVISESIEVNGMKNLPEKALKKIHKDLVKKELMDLMDPVKSVNSRISVAKSEE